MMVSAPYYSPFVMMNSDLKENIDDLNKQDWTHLEKDVQVEEKYLNTLFHDKHDYSHFLEK